MIFWFKISADCISTNHCLQWWMSNRATTNRHCPSTSYKARPFKTMQEKLKQRLSQPIHSQCLSLKHCIRFPCGCWCNEWVYGTQMALESPARFYPLMEKKKRSWRLFLEERIELYDPWSVSKKSNGTNYYTQSCEIVICETKYGKLTSKSKHHSMSSIIFMQAE